MKVNLPAPSSGYYCFSYQSPNHGISNNFFFFYGKQVFIILGHHNLPIWTQYNVIQIFTFYTSMDFPFLFNTSILLTNRIKKKTAVRLHALFVFVLRHLILSHGSRCLSQMWKTKLRKLPPGEGVGHQVTSKSTTCSLQMELMSALGQITKKAERFG